MSHKSDLEEARELVNRESSKWIRKPWTEPKLEKGENFSFVNVTAMSYGLPDDPPKHYKKHHHHN